MKPSLQERPTYGISPQRWKIYVFVDCNSIPAHEQHGFYTMSNALRSFFASLPRIQGEYPLAKRLEIHVLEEDKA